MLQKALQTLKRYFYFGLLLFLFPLPARPNDISVLLTNFGYLPGSDITSDMEFKIRQQLKTDLLAQTPLKIQITEDTLALTDYTINKNLLRARSAAAHVDFIVTGQIDLIGQKSWILGFNVLSTHSIDQDTAITPDPRRFPLEGTLEELLQSGVIMDVAQQIGDYLAQHYIKPAWWKSPRFLIGGGMIGASMIGFLIYETAWKKDKPGQLDPDLPTPPEPPGGN